MKETAMRFLAVIILFALFMVYALWPREIDVDHGCHKEVTKTGEVILVCK